MNVYMNRINLVEVVNFNAALMVSMIIDPGFPCHGFATP